MPLQFTILRLWFLIEKYNVLLMPTDLLWLSPQVLCKEFGWGTKVFVQNWLEPSKDILHRFCLTKESRASQDLVVYIPEPIEVIWQWFSIDINAICCYDFISILTWLMPLTIDWHLLGCLCCALADSSCGIGWIKRHMPKICQYASDYNTIVQLEKGTFSTAFMKVSFGIWIKMA